MSLSNEQLDEKDVFNCKYFCEHITLYFVSLTSSILWIQIKLEEQNHIFLKVTFNQKEQQKARYLIKLQSCKPHRTKANKQKTKSKTTKK